MPGMSAWQPAECIHRRGTTNGRLYRVQNDKRLVVGSWVWCSGFDVPQVAGAGESTHSDRPLRPQGLNTSTGRDGFYCSRFVCHAATEIQVQSIVPAGLNQFNNSLPC
jgi:hypothetical protein